MIRSIKNIMIHASKNKFNKFNLNFELKNTLKALKLMFYIFMYLQ
jgi:hypothetical protein